MRRSVKSRAALYNNKVKREVTISLLPFFLFVEDLSYRVSNFSPVFTSSE